MKISDKLILLFNNTIAKIKTTYNNYISRQLKEEDYFKTYLNFLNNSIYFSRYETTVNNIKITGKYLNEKVNYWNNHKVFELMYTTLITNYIKKHPSLTFSEDDGNVVNPFLTKGGIAKFSERMEPFTEKVPFNEWVELTYKDVILETSNTSVTAGPYTAPIEIGRYNWDKSQLDPFTQEVKTEFNKKTLENNLKKNIKRIVGVWEKDKNGSYNRDIDYPNTVNEDLAVWFGKKKKPKGSSQPKGPWVDICRKVDGKHPPCGRQDTSKGSYPKCRAAGVAGKMSDSAKRSACQRKRSAEKNDTQSGKGQKPIMVSNK